MRVYILVNKRVHYTSAFATVQVTQHVKQRGDCMRSKETEKTANRLGRAT